MWMAKITDGTWAHVISTRPNQIDTNRLDHRHKHKQTEPQTDTTATLHLEHGGKSGCSWFWIRPRTTLSISLLDLWNSPDSVLAIHITWSNHSVNPINFLRSFFLFPFHEYSQQSRQRSSKWERSLEKSGWWWQRWEWSRSWGRGRRRAFRKCVFFECFFKVFWWCTNFQLLEVRPGVWWLWNLKNLQEEVG